MNEKSLGFASRNRGGLNTWINVLADVFWYLPRTSSSLRKGRMTAEEFAANLGISRS
jgi:hypothetical protein